MSGIGARDKYRIRQEASSGLADVYTGGADTGAVSNRGGSVVLNTGDDDWMRQALEFVGREPAAVSRIGRTDAGRRAGGGDWLVAVLLVAGVALGGWWLWTR